MFGNAGAQPSDTTTQPSNTETKPIMRAATTTSITTIATQPSSMENQSKPTRATVKKIFGNTGAQASDTDTHTMEN